MDHIIFNMSQQHHKELPDNSQIYKSYEALYRLADKVNSNERASTERKPNRVVEEEEKQTGNFLDQKYSKFFENQKENRVPNQFENRPDLKLFQRRKFIDFNF